MFYLLLCLNFVSVHPASEKQGPLWTWMSDNYGCNNYKAQERLRGYLYYELRFLDASTRITLMSMIDVGFNDIPLKVGDDLMAANYVCDTGNNHHEMRNVGPKKEELDALYVFDGTQKDLRDRLPPSKRFPPIVGKPAETSASSPTIRKSSLPTANNRSGGNNNGVYWDDEFKEDDPIEMNKRRLAGKSHYKMRNVEPTEPLIDNAGHGGNNSEHNDRINNVDVIERNKWRPARKNHNRKKVIPIATFGKSAEIYGGKSIEKTDNDDVIETNKWHPAGNNHNKMRNVRPTSTIRKSSVRKSWKNMDNPGYGFNNTKQMDNDDVTERNKWRPAGKNHNKMRNIKPTPRNRISSMNMDNAGYGGNNTKPMADDDVVESNIWGHADFNHSKIRNVEPTSTIRKSLINMDNAGSGANNIDKKNNDKINNDDVIDTIKCDSATFRKSAIKDSMNIHASENKNDNDEAVDKNDDDYADYYAADHHHHHDKDDRNHHDKDDHHHNDRYEDDDIYEDNDENGDDGKIKKVL